MGEHAVQGVGQVVGVAGLERHDVHLAGLVVHRLVEVLDELLGHLDIARGAGDQKAVGAGVGRHDRAGPVVPAVAPRPLVQGAAERVRELLGVGHLEPERLQPAGRRAGLVELVDQGLDGLEVFVRGADEDGVAVGVAADEEVVVAAGTGLEAPEGVGDADGVAGLHVDHVDLLVRLAGRLIQRRDEVGNHPLLVVRRGDEQGVRAAGRRDHHGDKRPAPARPGHRHHLGPVDVIQGILHVVGIGMLEPDQACRGGGMGFRGGLEFIQDLLDGRPVVGRGGDKERVGLVLGRHVHRPGGAPAVGAMAEHAVQGVSDVIRLAGLERDDVDVPGLDVEGLVEFGDQLLGPLDVAGRAGDDEGAGARVGADGGLDGGAAPVPVAAPTAAEGGGDDLGQLPGVGHLEPEDAQAPDLPAGLVERPDQFLDAGHLVQRRGHDEAVRVGVGHDPRLHLRRRPPAIPRVPPGQHLLDRVGEVLGPGVLEFEDAHVAGLLG